MRPETFLIFERSNNWIDVIIKLNMNCKINNKQTHIMRDMRHLCTMRKHHKTTTHHHKHHHHTLSILQQNISTLSLKKDKHVD